jgi:hypothetical protein
MSETRDLYLKINGEYVSIGKYVVMEHTTTTYSIMHADPLPKPVVDFTGGLDDVADHSPNRYVYDTKFPYLQRKREHGKWWCRASYLQPDWMPSVVDWGVVPEGYTEVASEDDLPHDGKGREGISTTEDTPEPKPNRYFYRISDHRIQWKHENGKWQRRDLRNTQFPQWGEHRGTARLTLRTDEYREVATEADLPHGWEQYEGIPTDRDTPEPPSHITVLTDGSKDMPFLVRHPEAGWEWSRSISLGPRHCGWAWEEFAAEMYAFKVVK